mgnify:CR=1 FL=1
MRGERRMFHGVMAACGAFVLLMLGALVWVCLQPQTQDVQAAERHASENRARFGRTKAEKQRDALEQARLRDKLDGAKRED